MATEQVTQTDVAEWLEYEAYRASFCEHGCAPDERCEDCIDEATPWYTVSWKLPCGAHV